MEFILDGEESVEQEGTVSLKGRFEVEDEDGWKAKSKKTCDQRDQKMCLNWSEK